MVRVAMKLSFDNTESLEEAVGSLCFNNPPSDSNTLSSSMPPQGQETQEPERSEVT